MDPRYYLVRKEQRKTIIFMYTKGPSNGVPVVVVKGTTRFPPHQPVGEQGNLQSIFTDNCYYFWYIFL